MTAARPGVFSACLSCHFCVNYLMLVCVHARVSLFHHSEFSRGGARGGSRGGYRGGRGGFGSAAPGAPGTAVEKGRRREREGHVSGTGRDHTAPKGGAGKGNWGTGCVVSWHSL